VFLLVLRLNQHVAFVETRYREHFQIELFGVRAYICFRTTTLAQSVSASQTAIPITRPIQIVAEDVFMWADGPQCSV